MILDNVKALALFRPDKMGKADLAAASNLFAGLNCFEPAQQHAAHVHPDQDKLYFVVEGTAEITIGDESATVGPGALALAPAGVEHSIRNAGATRLITLVVFSPPPTPKPA